MDHGHIQYKPWWCEEWARGRYALDTSFRITDMEVAYYFGHLHQWKWSYELYVQTWESGRTRAYKLLKQGGKEKSPSWEEIDKFPGHPFNDPAKSTKYPSKKEIYKRWDSIIDKQISPKLNNIALNIRWEHQMAEEQVVVWENNKPVWKRRLYARFVGDDENNFRTVERKFVIEVKQDYPGGPFTFSKGKWKEYMDIGLNI